MRRLWCDPVSEYHGDFYDLPACRQYPKPVQKPHPPIHFGGEIQISVSPYFRPADLDAVKRYRDAGVDQVILLCVAGDVSGLKARLDALASQIVEPARVR
jgi:hypothetical protein